MVKPPCEVSNRIMIAFLLAGSLRPLRLGDAIVAGQIAVAAYASIARRDKRCRHLACLISAMLEHQPRARTQMIRCQGDQMPQRFHAAVSRSQCGGGLVAQRLQPRGANQSPSTNSI